MLFMISNTTQICWKIFCIMKFQRFIAIYRLWRPSWTPFLKIIAFPMWDLGGLLVCYLWYQILPKSVEKPFVAISWGLNCRLTRLLTVLSMLIRGITITLTGDWHSGGLATLSPSFTIVIRNSLLTEGKILHISVLGMLWLTQIMFQLLNTTVT